MQPNKKRRLESGRCEKISQVDLDAQQLFSNLKDSLQNGSLSVENLDHYEERFQSILHAHKSQISDLEQEISSLRSKQLTESRKDSCEKKETERTVAEFAQEKAIATMQKVQFANPKGKMFVEFFPSYMTVRPQSRHDTCEPAVICFADIDLAIAVPTKHETSSITAWFMKQRVPLRYQKAKRSSAGFCVAFESNSDPEDYQLEINVGNINGKAEIEPILKGSREHVFNELLAKLSGLSIERHDRTIFRSAMGKGQFYVTSALGANTGNLYPLRCGLLFTKPLMFIPTSNMASFHSGRDSTSGLRFFDFNVIRKEVQEKQKKVESFSMISVQESAGIVAYFNSIRVPNTALVEARKKAQADQAENGNAADVSEEQPELKATEENTDTANGNEEEDDGNDSMSSDDSDFDLDEELDTFYQRGHDSEDRDSEDEHSEDGEMEEMRALAKKERERQPLTLSRPKQPSRDAKIDLTNSEDDSSDKHDCAKPRVEDGGGSSSSTESDAEMNEPLFDFSPKHVDLTSGDKDDSDVEMTETAEKTSVQVVDSTAPTNTQPKKRKRRWHRPKKNTGGRD